LTDKFIYIYSARHLVPTTFIGLADPLTPPKMEMYDQKNKCNFEAKTFLYKVTISFHSIVEIEGLKVAQVYNVHEKMAAINLY